MLLSTAWYGHVERQWILYHCTCSRSVGEGSGDDICAFWERNFGLCGGGEGGGPCGRGTD